jgi:hypothetical protein
LQGRTGLVRRGAGASARDPEDGALVNIV